MLVSTALLAFIVLGLTAMFVQTQKAFKSGIRQSNVTDGGRAVMDMIAADISQLSDPHFTNVTFPTNFSGAPPTLYWACYSPLNLVQWENNAPFRTNQLDDIFMTVQTNAQWLGIGYSVSNWFTNGSGGAIPGVGTLYRYFSSTNAPLSTNNYLFANFSQQVAYGLYTNTYFHRIADGIVHLKITAYDADGNEMVWEPNYDLNGINSGFTNMQYPVIETNAFNVVVTNYLPHSVDIELGMLEPEAFEQARALYTSGATVAASNFLANAAGQVQVYRQHIIIPAAP